MKLLLKPILIAALLGSASFALAAEGPFTGTWKLNLDKSNFTGDTVKFSSTAGGTRMTGGGESYEFKGDGSESKTRFGTAAWKKINDNTWEETDMVNGRLDSKTTWTLSDDGKTLTARVTGDKPGGGSFDDTAIYARTAGTKGLTGTWKDKEFKGSSPSLFTLTETGNSLTFDEPDFKLKAVGEFNGKPGTVEGPVDSTRGLVRAGEGRPTQLQDDADTKRKASGRLDLDCVGGWKVDHRRVADRRHDRSADHSGV